MNVTKEQMREIKELKNAVGRIMEGANGSMFMCVLTSLTRVCSGVVIPPSGSSLLKL
jgi:hypothetical protein